MNEAVSKVILRQFFYILLIMNLNQLARLKKCRILFQELKSYKMELSSHFVGIFSKIVSK